MAYQPWIGLRTNRPCRHAPYRDCRRYILSHHGAGPYAHAAAYLYIVYYAHSRTDIHVIAQHGSLRQRGAYGGKLAETCVIAYHCRRIYNQALAVLYAQTIAYHCRGRHKQTVDTLIALKHHFCQRVQPAFSVLGQTKPEREADTRACETTEPYPPQRVYTAVVTLRIRAYKLGTVRIAARHGNHHLLARNAVCPVFHISYIPASVYTEMRQTSGIR